MDQIQDLEQMPPAIRNAFIAFEKKIRTLEERLSDQNYSLTGFVDSEFKRRDKRETHRTTEFSIYKAWCIDTLDPRKQGRVRYFSPYLHEPGITVDECPFAEPVSPLGGFDDCGCTWIPPAGSSLIIIFEAGSPHIGYYIGTMWNRDRGESGHEHWYELIDEGIPEYTQIHAGHRRGYFHGAFEENTERQVLPQWNTENYEQYDWDGKTPDRDKPPHDVAYPHIYGFKTPQKHMIKFVDGNYNCNHRWKRLEIMSSLGNWMIFKDDHLHEGGQWANPECNVPSASGGQANCVDEEGNPIEKRPAWAPCGDAQMGEARNKYFKHKNECRPYRGPGTPQNNRCELPQAGIQILSTSGISLIFDDSVEQPQGVPQWEKSMEPFDFGCTNVCLCKAIIKSTTGHRIELNDEEKETNVRGRTSPIQYPADIAQKYDPWNRTILERQGPSRNGILLLTATGNRVELNDDTDPGGTAGINRGIALQSTCNHVIEMVDYLNTQKSLPRMDGGQPIPKAKQGWIRIRSGYGLSMEFRDYFSQEKTDQQYIQIFAPQSTAPAGPHIIRIQEDPDCGYIFVRAAGDYARITAGNEVIVIGSEGGQALGPKSYFRYATKDTVVASKKIYFNYTGDTHVFFAERYIILAAGRDCKGPDGPAPCLYQVATAKCAQYCPIIRNRVCLHPYSFSTKVFASTNAQGGGKCKCD